jgi:hypothetical protein
LIGSINAFVVLLAILCRIYAPGVKPGEMDDQGMITH